MPAVQAISDAENRHNIFTGSGTTMVTPIGGGSQIPEAEDFYNNVIAAKNAATSDMLRIAGILIVIILVASVVAAWLLMHFGYTITEEKHREIVLELEKRHKADFEAVGETYDAPVAEGPQQE